MPAVLVLQKRHPLALQGSRQDHSRPARFPRPLQGLPDLPDLVPVHLEDIPSESLEFPLIRPEVMAVHGGLRLRQPVDVRHSRQVVQPQVDRRVGRLPDRSLRHLTVPHHHVGPPAGPGQLLGRGHAHAHRQPLSQRTGGSLDPLHPRGGVPFQHTRDLAQVHQAAHRNDPGLGIGRPQNRRSMPLGQDELVVPPVVRVFDVVLHLVKEQAGGDLRHRHTGRGMARSGPAGHLERVDPQLFRDQSQIFILAHGNKLLPSKASIT